MMHLQLDIQGSLRPTSRSISGLHGKGSRMMFRSMSRSVQFVSQIREGTHILQTKFAHFFAIPSTYTTAQVADLFFIEIFKLHGLPSFIISDQDNKFMITFWQELFRLCCTYLTPNTSYHPQTDGQTKIVNK